MPNSYIIYLPTLKMSISIHSPLFPLLLLSLYLIISIMLTLYYIVNNLSLLMLYSIPLVLLNQSTSYLNPPNTSNTLYLINLISSSPPFYIIYYTPSTT